MKKVVLLLIILVACEAYSQVPYVSGSVNVKNYVSKNLSEVADDTTYWFKVKGNQPFDLTVVFTYASTDSIPMDILKGSVKNDSIYYQSIGSLTNLTFPITLIKSVYSYTSEGDTMNSVKVETDYWNEELIGVFLNPDSDTGTVQILIDR